MGNSGECRGVSAAVSEARWSRRSIVGAGWLALVLAVGVAATPVNALSDTPQAAPAIVEAPYPGVLGINVDLSKAPRGIYTVTETIPVRPGGFSFFYPEWVDPDHSPDGPLANIAGLTITAGGNRLPWHRDLRDMYLFRVNVPSGATEIRLSFQYLNPGRGARRGDTVLAGSNLVDVAFNQVAFYPAGYQIRNIRVAPTVQLPPGWKFATAMEVERRTGDTVLFKTMTFNDFVDSPLIAGTYFNRVRLDTSHDIAAPVYLDAIGDAPEDIRLSEGQTRAYQRMVKELYALFGSHHFEHYDLLLVMSSQLPQDNLEHKQSSDNRMEADFLRNQENFLAHAYLPVHEFIHSWNGKFRRPEDMWAPNYNLPQQNDLIWVYEGLTQYWSGVITTRSGMWTPEQFREWLAANAAQMSHRTGRGWRSLQDVADSAQLQYGNGEYWHNYRRATDFYPEGILLWLDVDTEIRQLSRNRRSLDDFAKVFFGMNDGQRTTSTYSLDDLVAALNRIQPYDWLAFLRKRLDYVGPDLPEHGIERSGWQLQYMEKADGSTVYSRRGVVTYSLGLSVGEDGTVDDVQWGGPAFEAGIVPGQKIINVNGAKYTKDLIANTIKDSSNKDKEINLSVLSHGNQVRLTIRYAGDPRYPRLVRSRNQSDLLRGILEQGRKDSDYVGSQ